MEGVVIHGEQMHKISMNKIDRQGSSKRKRKNKV
jgi:hypothetical protein